MKLSSGKNHLIGISSAFVIGLFFYLLHPGPTLVYSYDDKNTSLLIWNVGIYQATGITIGINSDDHSIIQSVRHSKINGEPIINYTSVENGILYYIPHLYPQEKITFNLITKSNNFSNPDITIRSNENQGIGIAQFFTNELAYLQVFFIIITFVLAALTYLVVNGFLRRYMHRFTEPKTI